MVVIENGELVQPRSLELRRGLASAAGQRLVSACDTRILPNSTRSGPTIFETQSAACSGIRRVERRRRRLTLVPARASSRSVRPAPSRGRRARSRLRARRAYSPAGSSSRPSTMRRSAMYSALGDCCTAPRRLLRRRTVFARRAPRRRCEGREVVSSGYRRAAADRIGARRPTGMEREPLEAAR